MAETILDRRACQAGERIFREGDSGSQAFIIQKGEVEIIKTVDDKPKLLGTIGKGGIFGEMALLDDSPRMATARAKTAATLIVVTRSMFEEKMAKTDPFVRGLLKVFAETIRSISASSSTTSAPAAEAAKEEES